MSIVYQIKKKVISHEDEPVVEEDFFSGLIDDENIGMTLLRKLTRLVVPQTTEDFIEILLYLFALILICLIIKYVNAVPSTNKK